MSQLRLPGPAWTLDVDTVETALKVDHRVGLTAVESAMRRRRRWRRPQLGWSLLRWSLHYVGFVAALIAAVASIAWAIGEDAFSRVVVILGLANIAIWAAAAWFALRAFSTVESLGRMVRVLRDGIVQRIPEDALVVGDVVRLTAGSVITTDLRLVEVDGLVLSERRGVRAAGVDAACASERCANMAHRGDLVTSGSGLGVVVPISVGRTHATGRRSQAG